MKLGGDERSEKTKGKGKNMAKVFYMKKVKKVNVNVPIVKYYIASYS